jgi:hypothetical protein
MPTVQRLQRSPTIPAAMAVTVASAAGGSATAQTVTQDAAPTQLGDALNVTQLPLSGDSAVTRSENGLVTDARHSLSRNAASSLGRLFRTLNDHTLTCAVNGLVFAHGVGEKSVGAVTRKGNPYWVVRSFDT